MGSRRNLSRVAPTRDEPDWPCVLSITTGGLGLWALAARMLRRGAALTPGVTSLLAGLAALSLVNLEACVRRSHAFTITVVIWHGVTSAIVLATVVVLGRRVLRGSPRWNHRTRAV